MSASRGRKVQQYAPDGYTLIRTFAGMRDALRALSIASDGGIRQAARWHTLFRGSRWAFLDRGIPDDFVQDLPEFPDVPRPSCAHRSAVLNARVAMLDPGGTRVKHVYADLSTARDARMLGHVSSLSRAIKNGTRASGQRWAWWADVPKPLRRAYLARHGLPPRKPRPRSVAVERECVESGEVTRYDTVNAAVLANPMARTTLFAAIADATPRQGYVWRYG